MRKSTLLTICLDPEAKLMSDARVWCISQWYDSISQEKKSNQEM